MFKKHVFSEHSYPAPPSVEFSMFFAPTGVGVFVTPCALIGERKRVHRRCPQKPPSTKKRKAFQICFHRDRGVRVLNAVSQAGV
jgi:hypothetical protein